MVLLLAACGTGAPGAFGGLEGREFLSTAVVERSEDRPLVPGTEIRIGFQDDQLTASAGCNTFGAAYRVEGGRLIVEGGSMTEMGCDDERSAQDEWLFAFLGSQPQITVSDDELTLSAGETVITLVDREVAEPDLALVGPTWTIESIIVGDAASSVPAGATASISFADDGTMSAETGCNTGGARYEVEGDELRLSPFELTLMGCDGAAGQLEQAVVAVLGSGRASYQIESDTLTLMAGNRGLVLRGT
jgi:heat shock protein HslJ